jgi:hypothetical protein
MICWALLLLLIPTLRAALAPDTVQLRASLTAVHGLRAIDKATYARLREQYFAWVDTRIRQRRPIAQMNAELQGAGLFPAGLAEDDRRIGHLEPIATPPVRHAPGLLALQVTMHREPACGWDHTVLLYSRQTRQRIATLRAGGEEEALAYGLLGIDAAWQAGALLTGTHWVASNCTSSWNIQRVRIDRRETSGKITTLLQKAVHAQLFDAERVDVLPNLVRFHYNGAVGDGEIISTPVIAAYRLTPAGIKRVAPLARTRAGFLVEWQGLNPNAAPSLGPHSLEWGTIARCPGSPETWEVEVRDRPSQATFVFRIQGSRVSQLRMAAVKKTLDRACKPDTTGDLVSIERELPP